MSYPEITDLHIKMWRLQPKERIDLYNKINEILETFPLSYNDIFPGKPTEKVHQHTRKITIEFVIDADRCREKIRNKIITGEIKIQD